MSRVGWAIAVLMIAGSLNAAFAQDRPQGSFGAFWASFQAAVKARDADKVAALTRFPILVRGQLDADKPRRVDRAQFKKDLPRWLDQDTGLSARGETMRAYVLRTDAATLEGGRQRETSDRLIHAGAFQFERTDGGWRLTQVYEER
jgi:hypothetical protein